MIYNIDIEEYTSHFQMLHSNPLAKYYRCRVNGGKGSPGISSWGTRRWKDLHSIGVL